MSYIVAKIKESQDLDERLINDAKKIDKNYFKKCEVLLDGLKHSSRFALFNELFMVGRRILLLYPAMFIVGKSWLHIFLYMCSNLFFLVYLVGVKPFVEPS